MVGSLRAKLFVLLLAPILLVSGLAAVASFDLLQQSFVSLLQQRMAVLADDVGNLAEENDTLGQSLAGFTPLQRRVEVEKTRNPDVAAIAVLNGDRAVLFDSDRSRIGSQAPADWFPDGEVGVASWSRSAGTGLVIGSPIINSFGRPIGTVVVRVSNALVGFRKADTFRTVGLVGGAFVLLAAWAAFLSAGALARPLRAGLAAAAAELDHAGAVASAEAQPGVAGLPARIAVLLGPVADAERLVRQIDEAG